MAAKKTRKLSKKSGKKVQKPARRPGGSGASAKKSASARAKLPARKVAAKKRPAAKKAAPARRAAPPKRAVAARPKAKAPKPKKKVARALVAKKAAPARLAKKAAPAKAAKKLAQALVARALVAPVKLPPLKAAPTKAAAPVKKSVLSLRDRREPEAALRSGLPSRGGRERPGASTPPANGKRGSEPPSSKGAKAGKAGKPGGRERLVREPPSRLITMPLPMIQPPKRLTVEERSVTIDARLAAQTEEFRRRYIDSFDMSWIYHDSALEGVVYTFEELRTALTGQVAPVSDSSLQPTYDDIRRHKEAIEFVRDFALKKKLPVTLDVIKKIYLILHPAEGDIKTVKYRKDIPQHRLYFHEYAAPDKIAYKVRQIVDWLNDPETRKTRNGVRIAARAHYDLLRVYPFPVDSGKAARLFMNLLLMRSGLPPAILHSTERQRYYEALKGSATTVLQMVQEAVENALSSVEKLLDEHETKKRGFVS